MRNTCIFITGATSGFGEACARRFAREGARLIVLGRRAARLDALCAGLGIPVHAIEADVRDHAALERAVAGLPRDFADVDVLINSAGLALGLGKAHEADFEDWRTMIDTNCTGLAACTHALLPGMIERNRGHIVNMGSVAGSHPYPGANVYGGTKAFVRQFSLCLRADLLGTNIRVSNIEPGAAETEFSLVRFKGDAARAAKVYEGMQPLSAEDVADIVYWTVSLPAHINVNTLEVMPVSQAFGGFAIHRDPARKS